MNMKLTALYQVCKLIPANLVSKLAGKYGVDKRSRKFTPWSHVVSMLYAHLGHCLSLNDVCDSLRQRAGYLKVIRQAVPPSRNGLSHANMVRDAGMAEELFWSVLDYLQQLRPGFGYKHKFSGIPRRFKRVINVLDSTTLQLVVNCIDWATHRRKKAAVKAHVNLNIKTFLPSVVVVGKGSEHDSTKSRILCAGMKSGEIVIADKAYVDFEHLYELTRRGILWVTRAKDNMQYEIISRRECSGKIIMDAEISLVGHYSLKGYPQTFRLVRAIVEVDGKEREMVFITNNFEWAPSSICDLYKSRWTIEVFFKQMKQTLQIADFLGHNENAVRWQIWTALLAYIILRFIEVCSQWPGSFARLFTCVKSALWCRGDLYKLLNECVSTRTRANPEQVYLPGFEQSVTV